MLVHLMLELYGCRRDLLSDEPLVRRELNEYPGRIGMEKVSPVHLYDIDTSNPLDAGMSGFVVIAQSHVSMPGQSMVKWTSISALAKSSAREMPLYSLGSCSRQTM